MMKTKTHGIISKLNSPHRFKLIKFSFVLTKKETKVYQALNLMIIFVTQKKIMIDLLKKKSNLFLYFR